MGAAGTAAELESLVGSELGVSDWLTIDQARISAFADVTDDHNFVHVDAERAAAAGFVGTIAHGLLTLSMIVFLTRDLVPEIDGTSVVLNYGFDRVRFPAAVPEGARIRARTALNALQARGPGRYLMTLGVSVEVEGEDKPAVVADWLSLHIAG